MIETAYLPTILPELIKESTLRAIDEDKELSITRYNTTSRLSLPGTSEEICIANASKSLHTPEKIHQMFAKGIVYRKTTLISPIKITFYQLLSAPFTKFYNSFEEINVKDMKNLGGVKSKFIRKLDGTLVTRFVDRGRVYFSTRGRIINLENNDFWDLTKKIISEKKDYEVLLDPSFAQRYTLMFELIGPSNMIVEFHSEDDLVLTGVYSRDDNVFFDAPEGLRFLGLSLVETYDGDSAEEIINSWEGIREGVVINFYKFDRNLMRDVVVYRTKIKQEAYLNLVRAKNNASKANLFDIVTTNNFHTWEEVEIFLYSVLGGSGYIEELINYYKGEWDEVSSSVESLRDEVRYIKKFSDEISSLPSRKEQFFASKEKLGSLAGMAMSFLDGKLSDTEAVIYLSKKKT